MQKAQSWSNRTRVIIVRRDKVVLRKERMTLIRRHLDQNFERAVISEKTQNRRSQNRFPLNKLVEIVELQLGHFIKIIWQ